MLIVYHITVQIAFTYKNNLNIIVWPNNAALINTNPQREKEYWIDMQVKPGGNCRDLLLSSSIWEAGDNDSWYIRCQQQQTDKWLEDNITEDSGALPANMGEPSWDGMNVFMLFNHLLNCWGKSQRCFLFHVESENAGREEIGCSEFQQEAQGQRTSSQWY